MCYNYPMTYELISVENGVERRKYPNGDIRDQNGRLLERPERVKANEITPENARAMVARRREKMLEAVEQGVMRATDAPDVHAAVARIMETRAKVALQDKGRAGNDAARLVLAALDAMPEKQAEIVHTQRHVHEIDPETVEILEGMLRARRDNVIDAVFEEA